MTHMTPCARNQSWNPARMTGCGLPYPSQNSPPPTPTACSKGGKTFGGGKFFGGRRCYQVPLRGSYTAPCYTLCYILRIPCAVDHIMHTVYCIVYPVGWPLCTVHRIPYTRYKILYTINCTRHTVYGILYTAYGILRTLYTISCILYAVCSTLFYTARRRAQDAGDAQKLNPPESPGGGNYWGVKTFGGIR